MKRKSVFGEIIWGNYVVILRLLFLIVTSFHPNLASLGFALNNAMNIMMYLFDFQKMCDEYSTYHYNCSPICMSFYDDERL